MLHLNFMNINWISRDTLLHYCPHVLDYVHIKYSLLSSQYPYWFNVLGLETVGSCVHMRNMQVKITRVCPVAVGISRTDQQRTYTKNIVIDLTTSKIRYYL